MPTNKQTKQEFTKVNKTLKVEDSTDDNFNDPSKSKKPVRKAGRTLLVKSVSGNAINSSVFEGLEGLKNKSETKSTSSYFLTFDTVLNAINAYRKLRSESSDYRVKYSYYRIFFTMNGLTESSDYNQVKKDLVEWVDKNTGASVLFCKLYRQETKYLGCGDFTIDTLDGMNTLLSKEGGFKEFTIGSLSGTFYRYNGKKDKSENNQESTTA